MQRWSSIESKALFPFRLLHLVNVQNVITMWRIKLKLWWTEAQKQFKQNRKYELAHFGIYIPTSWCFCLKKWSYDMFTIGNNVLFRKRMLKISTSFVFPFIFFLLKVKKRLWERAIVNYCWWWNLLIKWTLTTQKLKKFSVRIIGRLIRVWPNKAKGG